MRQGRTSIRLSMFICMSKEFLQVYFKDVCESPYLKHLHSFIPPFVIFFSFCRRPLKIPENNICFQMIGVESSIVFFSFESSCSFFPTEKLPDFSFYFKIMLLNQMIQFRFLLLRLKKKGGKKKSLCCGIQQTVHSLLFQTLSAAVFQQQSKWIYNSKPHSSWIFVLASNQDLAPAVLDPNFFNSFLFFILVLRVRAKEIHLQVFIEQQSLSLEQ